MRSAGSLGLDQKKSTCAFNLMSGRVSKEKSVNERFNFKDDSRECSLEVNIDN